MSETTVVVVPADGEPAGGEPAPVYVTGPELDARLELLEQRIGERIDAVSRTAVDATLSAGEAVEAAAEAAVVAAVAAEQAEQAADEDQDDDQDEDDPGTDGGGGESAGESEGPQAPRPRAERASTGQDQGGAETRNQRAGGYGASWLRRV